MHFVTKPTPIGYIDIKCHIKKLKSSKTCLIGCSGFNSHEWFVIAWGANTQTQTHTDFLNKNNFTGGHLILKLGSVKPLQSDTYVDCVSKSLCKSFAGGPSYGNSVSTCSVIAFHKYIQVFIQAENSMTGT